MDNLDQDEKPVEKCGTPAEETPAVDDEVSSAPVERTEPGAGADSSGDWAAQATAKLFSAVETIQGSSTWKAMEKVADTASQYLPGILDLGELQGAKPVDPGSSPNKSDSPKDGQAPEKPALPAKDARVTGGFFELFKVDSLSSLLRPEKSESPFDAATRRDPFDKGTKTDPFFKGFAFDTLAGSVMDAGLAAGTAYGLGRVAFSAAGAALAGQGKSFDFDGLLGSDFFRSGENKGTSSGKGLFGFTSLDVGSMGRSLSEFFYSGKSADKASTSNTKPELTSLAGGDKGDQSLVGQAIDGAKKIGSAIVSGSSALLEEIFGAGNDVTVTKKQDAGDAGGRGDGWGEGGERRVVRDREGKVTYEGTTPDGKPLKVTTTEREVVAETEQGRIRQGRQEVDGRREVDVQTTDGRRLQQGTDGRRVASNEKSDLVVEQKGDKVLVSDKRGRPVMEFANAGDARRFFDDGVLEMTKPGETVEQALARLRQDKGDELQGKGVVVMDGKGNVLSVDEHGNQMRRHPNGSVELTYRKTDDQGQVSTVAVRLTPRGNGTKMEIRQADGTYVDASRMSESDLRDKLAGTDLSWRDHCLHRRRCHGRREGGSRRGDDKPDTEDTQPVIGPDGRIRIQDHATLDQTTGQVTAQDGDKEVKAQGDPATGQTVISDSSGYVMTRTPSGEIKIERPGTDDRITFDPHSGTVRAWDMEMGPQGARVHHKDGSRTDIDDKGNFNLFDRSGKSILSSHDNVLDFWDGTRILGDNSVENCDFFEDYYEAVEEFEQELAEIHARDTANQVSSFVSSLVSGTAGVIDPGAVASLLGMIAGAEAKLKELGLDTSVLDAARKALLDARGQFDRQVSFQHKLNSLGKLNATTIGYALRAGTTSAEIAAQYAVDRYENESDRLDTATA